MIYETIIKDPIFIYKEKLNVKKINGLLRNYSKKDIKDIFFDQENIHKDGLKWKTTDYMNVVIKYLKSTIKKCVPTEEAVIIQKKYRFGRNRNGGRMYVENNGLQMLQHELKNYLCGEYYVDIDIINCIPSLLYYTFEKNEIFSPYLKDYIDNRDSVLFNHNLSKQDIIIIINKDINYERKTNSKYLNSLIGELTTNKEILYNILQNTELDIKTSNSTNKISSIVGEYLKIIEADIVQQVLKHFLSIDKSLCMINMFDGLNIEKKDSINYENELDTINKMFLPMKYIKFKYKSLTTEIELDTEDKEFLEYDRVKLDFEKKHFLVNNPYTFWNSTKDLYGVNQFNQVGITEFKLICEQYKIEEFKSDGSIKIVSIFNKWIADKKKREYESIDFLPYGNINNTPSHIFNTFEGFAIDKKKAERGDKKDINNFHKYIRNLCNENEEVIEYILNYLSHIIQYPAQRTEKIIVFAGWTGSGKDTLFRIMELIIGASMVSLTEDIDQVFGNFNGILDSKLMLFINEIEGKHATTHQERLKGLATGTSNMINVKNKKTIKQQNYIRLIALSNAINPVNIHSNDRRYVIINTGMALTSNCNCPIQKEYATNFWNKFYEDLKNPNYVYSIYSYLKNKDISKFDYRDPPSTMAKTIMKEKNTKKIYLYMEYIINNTAQFNRFHYCDKKKLNFFKWKPFFDDYLDWIELNDYSTDYKIRECDIKAELLRSGSFIPSKNIRLNGAVGKYCSFDMNLMDEFINKYLKEDTINEIIEDYTTIPLSKVELHNKLNDLI